MTPQGASSPNTKIWSTDTELTSASQWTEVGNLINGRWGHCSVSHDDFVLTSGGEGPAKLTSVELYDMSTSTITTLSSTLNVARTYHGCSIMIKENGDLELIVIGGIDTANKKLSSVEVATMSASGWSSFEIFDNALPAKSYDHTTTKVGKYLYTAGGATDDEWFGESILLSSDGGRHWTNITTTLLTDGRYAHNAVATYNLCPLRRLMRRRFEE